MDMKPIYKRIELEEKEARLKDPGLTFAYGDVVRFKRDVEFAGRMIRKGSIATVESNMEVTQYSLVEHGAWFDKQDLVLMHRATSASLKRVRDALGDEDKEENEP